MSCTNCGEDLKHVLGWKAWFDNSQVYDSRENKWEDLPDDGVQYIVIFYCDNTRQLQTSMDFYFQAPHSSGDTITGTGNSLADIKSRYPDAIIKSGRWSPDNYYYRIRNEALKAKWNAN